MFSRDFLTKPRIPSLKIKRLEARSEWTEPKNMRWGSSRDIESGFSRLGERNCAAYSKRQWRLDGKGLGGITHSSSGCGVASGTRRCICALTKPSAKRVARSASILSFITAEDRIRALTEAPRITPTSTRCHSAWQPKLAEALLINAKILFRQPGPARCQVFNNSNARYAELIEADPS
jgi:hypothetical protein